MQSEQIGVILWQNCLPNIIEVKEDMQRRILGNALFRIGNFDGDSYRENQ